MTANKKERAKLLREWRKLRKQWKATIDHNEGTDYCKGWSRGVEILVENVNKLMGLKKNA